jgi:hypothetical protein
MKITRRQLRRIIKEELSSVNEGEIADLKYASRDPAYGINPSQLAQIEGAQGISFDWDSSGLSMIMSVNGKEATSFSTQRDVRDLIKQLEDLLAGPMRTTG